MLRVQLGDPEWAPHRAALQQSQQLRAVLVEGMYDQEAPEMRRITTSQLNLRPEVEEMLTSPPICVGRDSK